MSHPIPDTPLTRRALAIATEAHAGQTRQLSSFATKVPYITHPIEVARIAIDLFNADVPDPDDICERIRELLVVVSYWHDVKENCLRYPLKAKMLELVNVGLLTAQEEDEIDDALDTLDRHNADGYLLYILRVKDGGYLTKIPKRSDLRHNMSDLPSGSRRDKYALALHILET